MRKTILFHLLLLVVAFGSCRTKENPAPNKYLNGFFVLNEGNFSQANGNLSFFDTANNTLTTDAVKAENNGTGLNGIVQNVAESVADNKICVVTNSTDQLVILNRNTLKSEGTVSTLANPYDVAIINGKAYVTEWGTNYFTNSYANAAIRVINLASRQITNTFLVGKEVNGIIALNNKIYVAVTGENKVWVINPATDQIETTITTANQPNNMEVDTNGKIWTICSSGNFTRINPANNTVEATISTVSILGYNERLAMNPTRTKLYWLGSTSAGFTSAGIFQLDITATSAPTAPLIAGSRFSGVGFSATRNQILAGILAPAPNSYSSAGEIGFYQVDGTLVSTTSSGGVAPNGFLVR